MRNSATVGCFGRQVLVTALAAAVCLGLSPGCGGPAAPPVSVPEDCRNWLDRYYDALKKKDYAAVQDMSCTIPARDASRIDAAGVAGMSAAKRQFKASLLQQMEKDLGTFKSYTVVFFRETVTEPDDPMANAFGAGRHISIVCKTKYSRRNATEEIVLYKGPDDPDFVVDAHKYTRPL